MPSSTALIMVVIVVIGMRLEAFRVAAEARATDTFLSDTLAKFQNGATRTVLLICGGNCAAERTQVARSIREYNALADFINGAAIRFRVQYFRRREGRASDSRFVDLIYVVAGRPIRYPHGDDVRGLKEWLGSLDAPPKSLFEHRELNDWIDEAAARTNACHPASLLLIHDRERCPMPYSLTLVNIVVRATDEANLMSLEIPLPRDFEVVLNWRVPYHSSACRVLLLFFAGRYIDLDADTDASELIELVAPTAPTDNANNNCSPTLSALVNGTSGREVRSAPNEVLLEFLSDEHSIKGLEHNQMYMLVGVVGGMAVVALAISIFWGLSGTSFTNKQ